MDMTPDPAAPHHVPPDGSQAVRDLDMSVERRLTRLEAQHDVTKDQLRSGNVRFQELTALRADLDRLKGAAERRGKVVRWVSDLVKAALIAIATWWLARRK